jgi:catechol 2,3-dioxygenase-like lactoylglutathione lyase family enzyme
MGSLQEAQRPRIPDHGARIVAARGRIQGLLLAALLVALSSWAAAAGPEDHADYVVLGKSVNTRQAADGTLSVLNTVFFAEIFETAAGTVRNGVLRGPGEAAAGLSFPEGDIHFLAGTRRDSVEALTRSFPDSTYFFSFDTPAGPVSNLPVTFRADRHGGRYPGPISLVLRQAGSEVAPDRIDPSLDLEVEWTPFERGAVDPLGIADDMIYVIFGNCLGEEVVHSGHAISDPDALTFRDTRFTIPAAALRPGEPWQLEVEHSEMDTDSREDIETIVTYAATTFLDLRTTGEAAGDRRCPEVPYAMDGGQTDREAPPRTAAPSLPEAGAAGAVFYYQDLEGAERFYREHLGLTPVRRTERTRVLEVAPGALLILADEAAAGYAPDTPRTAAIALVTAQLEGWYEALAERPELQFRSRLKTGPERPHDGFVLVDPGGYYLEFERFNPHPENDAFLPLLARAQTRLVDAPAAGLPAGLGFQATVLWFYYRDMARAVAFSEETLGFDLVVDQGWAKIYALPVAAGTAFFGPVDAARGMHGFTDEKAVALAFRDVQGAQLEGWLDATGFAAQRGPGLPDRAAPDVELRDSGGYRLLWLAAEGAAP